MGPYFVCCLILLTSLVEVLSEQKIVHRGETVLLFANVTADSPDNEVHLYINGVKDDARIASWKFENGRFTVVSRIYHNIGMDDNRNIRIFDVDEHYTGTYSLFNSSRLTIELIVLGNSQIKSENPSQNTLLWIVCIALAIVASAFILYVAYTKKCRKKNPACLTRMQTKHGPSEVTEEAIELANVEKQGVGEEANTYLLVRETTGYLDAKFKTLKEEIANVEKQRVEEEDMKYSHMMTTMADHFAKLKTLIIEKANVEKQRVEEEDVKYSHMMTTMADHFAKLKTLIIEKATLQNGLDEDESMPHSSEICSNFKLQHITDTIPRNRELIRVFDSVGENNKATLQIGLDEDESMPHSPEICSNFKLQHITDTTPRNKELIRVFDSLGENNKAKFQNDLDEDENMPRSLGILSYTKRNFELQKITDTISRNRELKRLFDSVGANNKVVMRDDALQFDPKA